MLIYASIEDMIKISLEVMMARRAIVGTWGANLAVRLPRDAARAAGFVQGMEVELEARRGEIIVRSAQPRYALADLLEGTTPEAMREAFEWGEDVGREQIV